MHKPACRYGPVVRQIIGGYAAPAAAALFCLASAAFLIVAEGPRLFLLNDAGYGDSYVLYDVQQFQGSGVIYRDLSRPPYTPSAYSPFVYIFYSLPGRIVSSENPFLGPRLMVVAAFILCIAMVVSITCTLIPKRFGWLWGLLLTTSIASMGKWVLQLRGDFPGIFFSLLAIRLLFVQSPWAILLAGVSAGFATQFKFTFLAALAAGSLYLLGRRRWKDVALFAAAGFLASAGIYLLYWLREPQMIVHLTSLRIGFIDPVGSLRFAYVALSEPVVLLALLAIPPTASHVSPRWALLGLFALTSFVIAGLTDLHPGGNINYFFEGLFAVVPAAALGVMRLLTFARRSIAVAVFVVALFLFQFPHQRLRERQERISDHTIGIRAVEADNQSFRRMQNVLRGQHIFSTVERLALLDPAPALVNAFSFWTINPEAIYDRIRSSEFDIVITASTAQKYRGVDYISPDLRQAIVTAYTPYCEIYGVLLHLPRNRPPGSALVQDLNKIGCASVAGPQGSARISSW